MTFGIELIISILAVAMAVALYIPRIVNYCTHRFYLLVRAEARTILQESQFRGPPGPKGKDGVDAKVNEVVLDAVDRHFNKLDGMCQRLHKRLTALEIKDS